MSLADDALKTLIDGLESEHIVPADPPTFFQFEKHLATLVASGYPARSLESELLKTLQEPTWLGRWKPNEQVLYASHRLELSIWCFSKPRQYIHTVSSHVMVSPCGQTGLRYRRFRLPPTYENRVFDRNLKLQYVDEGQTAPGEVLCLTAGGLLYDFLLDSPTPLVRLTYGPIETMEWLFHRDTGAAWKISDSDAAATQMRVAAYVLGQMSHTSSTTPLKHLTFHESHTVRWAAIQALSRISVSDAVERLRAAVNDPHPHIRRAAERTLSAMQPQRPS
jgi:hypothetical protein